MSEELKPCPFCGEIPDLPSGDGTQYEIECGSCAMAMASVQICDLMTGEERSAEKFTDYRYSERYVERAKAEAIKQWNTRATPPAAQVQGEREGFDCWFRREEGLPDSADTTYISAAYLPWKAWQARAALSAPPAADMTDAYVGAREDVATWKRRALEAEQKVRVLDQRIDQLVLDAQGETRMGEPHIAPPAAGAYKDDTRKPHELSAAGCRCVRFGEGNPNWPCLIHTNSAPPASERPAPVYLFRRKGLPDFCTCTAERFEELRGNSLFEVKVLHDLNMPASEQQQAVQQPHTVEFVGKTCQRVLMAEGKPYPRTCAVCGLSGPCKSFPRESDQRLNPHLAGVNQGVTTEAGNGEVGDAGE